MSSELSWNKLCLRDLPPFEQNEVKSYRDKGIYYLGIDATKIAQSVVPNCQDYSLFDKEKGYYKVFTRDHIIYRYEIKELLGTGTFGQVFMSFDHKERQNVAVKIMRRNYDKYCITEKINYKYLKVRLGNNTEGLCSMLHEFTFRDHSCIVFKLTWKNLFEKMRMNGFKPMRFDELKVIIRSILKGLVKLHSVNMFHGDIKLDNIALTNETSLKTTIIDLGSTKFGCYNSYAYLQCERFRSPEYLLGLPCGAPSDIWSLGIIAWQLATSTDIFRIGENSFDQMTTIIEVLDLPPANLLNQSSLRNVFFHENTVYPKYCTVKDGCRYYTMRRGKSPLGQARFLPGDKKVIQGLALCYPDFADFISKCLQWDPVNRLTAVSGLYHRWVREETFPNFTGIKPVKIGTSIFDDSGININSNKTPRLNLFNGKLLKSVSLIDCTAGLQHDNNMVWLKSRSERLLEMYRYNKRTTRFQRHSESSS